MKYLYYYFLFLDIKFLILVINRFPIIKKREFINIVIIKVVITDIFGISEGFERVYNIIIISIYIYEIKDYFGI